MVARFLFLDDLKGVAVHGNETDIFYEVEVEGITPEELRAIAPLGAPYYEEGDFGAWFGCFSVVGDVVVYYGSAELMPDSRVRWAELDPVTKRRYRRWWGENAERYASVSADMSGAGYDDLNLLNEELAKYRAAKGETDGRNLVACGDAAPHVGGRGVGGLADGEVSKREGETAMKEISRGIAIGTVIEEKRAIGRNPLVVVGHFPDGQDGILVAYLEDVAEPKKDRCLSLEYVMLDYQVKEGCELVPVAHIRSEAGAKEREEFRLLEARELRPDGRLVPVAGDAVYQRVAGAFGMPATIHGEVYQSKGKNGGLRVRVTGSSALIGSAKVGVTYPVSEWWTVVNDPRIKQMEEEAKERAAAKEAARQAEQDAAERTAQESFDAAVAAGDLPISEDTPLGATIIEHYSGEKSVLTLKSDLGFFGCEPGEISPGSGRGLGRMATWCVSIPLIDIEEEGRKRARAFYEDPENEWELKDALEHCDTAPAKPEWATYSYRYRDIVKEVAAKRGITLAMNTMQAV